MTSLLLQACLIILAVLAVCAPIAAEEDGTKGHFRHNDLFKKRTFKKVKAVNKSRFTQEEKDLIVKIHNAYRSVVEPPATDMREIEWNDQLEEYAYELTQNCTGAHSRGKMILKVGRNKVPKTLEKMDENLYFHYAPDYSIEQALHMFWEEGGSYDITTNICTHKHTCGHYKAMVRAKSTMVGCAITTCNEFSVSNYPTPANFMACIYNSKALIYKPYTVGERCSDCTRVKLGYLAQYCRHGLCISPRIKYKKIGYDGDVSVIGLKDDDRVP